MNPEKHTPPVATEPIDWLSIPLDPEAGPQIWYTDGHFAQRLDDDNIDNILDPTIRDIVLMRAALTLATHRVTQWEHEHWAALARETPKPPMPLYPSPPYLGGF